MILYILIVDFKVGERDMKDSELNGSGQLLDFICS